MHGKEAQLVDSLLDEPPCVCVSDCYYSHTMMGHNKGVPHGKG